MDDIPLPIEEPESKLNHDEFKSYIKSQLFEIIQNEELLKDIDTSMSLIELKNILSLEHGESINVLIKRADDQIISVIVKQNANVKNLKESIQNYYKIKHTKNPSQGTTHINWKYVWKTYGLIFDNEKLIDNNKSLRDYGIVNNSQLNFYRC